MKVEITKLFALAFVILFCSSCTTIESNKPEITLTPLVPTIYTPSPYNTNMSSTRTPTLSLPKTQIPSNTPTVRKMTSEEFHDLLLPDKVCHLPCWWEMEPGITTIEQATKQIASLGMTLSKPQDQKDGLVLYQEGVDFYTPNLLSNTVNIYTSNDIVSKIHISASSNYQESFWKIWSPYSPQLLLRQYVPDQILLLIYSKRPNRETGYVIYRLIFLFSENQTMIEYHGMTKEVDGEYSICPGYTNSGNLSPELIISIGDFEINQVGFSALEKVSKDSLETIINGIQSPEDYCVRSDKSFWQ